MMAEDQDSYRQALIAHHRRTAMTSALAGSTWLPLSLVRRIRQARRTRDPFAWTTIALTLATPALAWVLNYQRAEQRADDDLERDAAIRETQRRLREGRPVSVFANMSDGRTPLGCQLQTVLMTAGWVQATWDYLRRPDRSRRVIGRAWRWRPGPAWWTAWSFQQLPVNAASTAPRAEQIAYQRRQLITLRGTTLASTAVATWQTQLSRGLADWDRLRIAAGLAKLATEVVRDIADYRLVPDTVDHRRARRQRHDRAVAELISARATGLPGPRNPWRDDMVIAAGAVASMGTFLVNAGIRQRRLQKQRPKPPPSS